MSIVVNTNIGSLSAAILAESSRELSTAMERLSSTRKLTQLRTTLQASLLQNA